MFDVKYCQNLREAVNRTNIFYKDKIQSQKFDFICAFMDRFDFAVNYLNQHNEKPKTEIEFMTYLTQASIVRDGINLCYDLLELEKDETNIFFKEYCLRDLGCEPESDDKYYEYLRSLAFAHPLNTNRSIPNKLKDEKQFSPFCLLNVHSFNFDKNAVGVMVYSNKRKSFSITVPFQVLVEYLKYKYELLENIINKFNSIIKEMEDNWKKRKIDRTKSDLDILKEVSKILDERYLEHYDIDELIEYLEVDLSEKRNIINVEMYRDKIRKMIKENGAGKINSMLDCIKHVTEFLEMNTEHDFSPEEETYDDFVNNVLLRYAVFESQEDMIDFLDDVIMYIEDNDIEP